MAASVPSGLKAAGLGGSLLVGLGIVIEVQAAPWLRDPSARLTSILLELAALCVAGLTVGRARSIAWIAVILAVGVAAVEAIGAMRVEELAGVGMAWSVAFAGLARLATAAIALAYGLTRRGGRPRHLATADVLLIVAASAIVVIEAAVLGMWITTGASIDSWPQRIANRSALAFVALATAVGVTIDLAGPLGRARRRVGAPLALRRAPEFFDVLADELIPFRRTARREAFEAERARLAADLHAEVLPELRSALAAAHAAPVPVVMGQQLERAVDQIEDLMSARRSVVLESFGLVAALEWLAERTEARSPVVVQLEIDGDGEEASRPPIGVERAAFRIAQLALDNVVRHARARTATLSLSANATRVELQTVDDGVGFRSDVPTRGRGLADMRSEAAAVRASLEVTSGRGTTVELRWPEPGVR